MSLDCGEHFVKGLQKIQTGISRPVRGRKKISVSEDGSPAEHVGSQEMWGKM